MPAPLTPFLDYFIEGLPGCRGACSYYVSIGRQQRILRPETIALKQIIKFAIFFRVTAYSGFLHAFAVPDKLLVGRIETKPVAL